MEAKWSTRVHDVRTVHPVLSALEQAGVARFVQNHINDEDDLAASLQRWGRPGQKSFGIGYVAMHGSPGEVNIAGRSVPLLTLTQRIPRRPLTSKVLHFGSCSVLDGAPSDRRELRAAFGVRALTGFTEDVDWFESMAFELILFDVLTRYRRMDAADAYIRHHHRSLARRLGFVMVRG
jgi:hypothetical protein